MNIDNKYVNKAIDYILLNLECEIKVGDVAKHCNLSRFHFNRLFKEELGESVYSFIKRLRMEYSAIRLGLDTNKSITDIGMDYGYSSSNYSSAFTKHHSISPMKFRMLKKENQFDLKNPYDGIDIIYQDYRYYNDRITIKEIDDFSVVFKRYIGSYREMNLLWPKFIKEYGHLCNNETLFLDISYNDPNITDKERCLYELCMTLDKDVDLQNTKVLTGGRFATYHFKGPVKEINQAYKGIFNIWIPQSKYEMDHRIGFDCYINTAFENDYLEIDINIPIK